MKTFSQFIAEVNRSELYLSKKEEEQFKSLLNRVKAKKKKPDSNYKKEGGPVRIIRKAVSEENEAKTCPAGKYWCFTSKKCKKIPLGYYIGARGYLEKDDEEKKNGNGNGNGDSGSDVGGDGGGGMSEDYKRLPRDKMAKQYDRKKDKNYDEFHKKNPMGVGPNVSRGKSDTNIDKHGNSRETKRISGQLKNNPRFYDDSHEQWQRMQSKFKSKKNSSAAGEVARRLNPKSYGEEYILEGWSSKYKKSIDCKNPKGFSQKAHCAGRKKRKV